MMPDWNLIVQVDITVGRARLPDNIPTLCPPYPAMRTLHYLSFPTSLHASVPWRPLHRHQIQIAFGAQLGHNLPGVGFACQRVCQPLSWLVLVSSSPYLIFPHIFRFPLVMPRIPDALPPRHTSPHEIKLYFDPGPPRRPPHRERRLGPQNARTDRDAAGAHGRCRARRHAGALVRQAADARAPGAARPGVARNPRRRRMVGRPWFSSRRPPAPPATPPRRRPWPRSNSASAPNRSACVHVDAAHQPEIAGAFGILTVPSTVVLDPDGRVAAVNHGFASTQQLVRQLQTA